jgi:hypothetical protein
MDMGESIKNNQSDEKNENIIVWLDFDAYSYLNFAIISALSKLGKFNFIGIVTTRQDITFFQNQKLIQFKKLLYYPDCYINKYSFNIKNLKNFEKQFNLNLWLDIFAERSFYKYWTDFHKFSKDEIFSITENSISFFINVLEEFKPKLILMQQPGENISNLLLYQIAKKMGIKTLMPTILYLKNRILISDNLNSEEISNRFKKLIPNFNNSSQIYDEEFIKKENHAESIREYLSFNHNTRNIFQKFRYYIKRMWNEPEPIYLNKGKTKLKLNKIRIQNLFKIKKRKQFLDNNAIKLIKDEKFIYFPLASEPEARIIVKSPFYTNQITLAENIAKSIPIDFILYVKEHPVQKIKLWRSIEDYQKLVDLPNVKLVHPNVNSQELILKSQGIVSISGSTTFESIFYKKPVIIFTEEHYDVLSMVTKIKTLADLPNELNHALSNFKFNNNELNAFMESFYQETISIRYPSIIKDASMLSSIQRQEHDFDLTMQHFQKFFETYKKDFELIAQTIFLKSN